MPGLSLSFNTEQVGEQLKRTAQRGALRVTRSFQGAANDAASEILSRGRRDIASAGNFGGEWVSGLQVALTQGGGNIRLSVSHSKPWFWVHEKGALIKGNPLLWLPLSFAGVPKGVYARNYPGRLFRVDRLSGGPPLLMDAADRQAKYVGLPEVTVKKKFHIEEIVADVSRKLKTFYQARFRANG